MVSSGDCLAGQIQVSHFLCSFLFSIWVSASTDHCVAASTALTFTVEPRICCESARNSFLAVHCSSVVLVLLPACAAPCVHLIELLFHMWLSCSLHIRFNQLRSDGHLLPSACDDLPCILDTIFIRLVLDNSCCGRRGLRQVGLLSLIPFCDPLLRWLHMSVRPSAWLMTVGNSALCVTGQLATHPSASQSFPNCVPQLSEISSSDCVLSSSGSSFCSVIRLASVSVGQTTLRSWSVGTARFSFTALAIFSIFLLQCPCALSDLASPAPLSLLTLLSSVQVWRGLQ